MVCGKGSNLVAAEAERAEGDGADKLQPFANGFFYQGSGNSFKFAENALASTVVDAAGTELRILRQGSLHLEDFQNR